MMRAALIGLGNIAWKYDQGRPPTDFALSQGGAMRRHPEVQLVGGCSPERADREGFSDWSQGVPVFETPKAMLDQLQPEMVGICSPTHDHFDHARLCLEAGVRVLWLEKPPTETLDELQALITLADKKNATVCVNYFRRYLPSYQRLKQLIQTQEYGTCHLLRLLYSPGLARNGVHFLDQLFYVTGATAYAIDWVERGRDSENPAFTLRLSTGQRVQAFGAQLCYHSNDIDAVCDRGVFSIHHGGKQATAEIAQENSLFPGFYDLTPVTPSPFGEVSFERYMDRVLEDLVASANEGSLPQSNLHSAYCTQALMEDILAKAKT
ncbi:Gfo/Idh/MocA family protein [Desulfovibrio cuneatus]|uniref:Gfo/Idh/MocA family protein n=1 Tax=Desulfovibrio cuneatus TaxID=159728 RepID=UPI000400301E|nr:Gfo/Idh/MocA family oxidoreductase [Desulfovibrio cuneatus]